MVRISVLLTVLTAALVVGVFLVAILYRKRRFQYSLRTLMIGCTLVAVVLSAVQSWRYWTTAHTVWLDSSSPEARRFLAVTEIVERGEGFTATFRPNFRNLGDLVNIVEKAAIPSGSGMNSRFDHQSQQMRFETAERKPLEDRLALLTASDVLQPGWFVIRGRVEDSSGDPVGGAIVDLMGGYVYINHFQTRPDGAFLMPIQAPAGNGYYLRIRYQDDTRRMNTQSFSLDPANPEKVVRIQVK